MLPSENYCYLSVCSQLLKAVKSLKGVILLVTQFEELTHVTILFSSFDQRNSGNRLFNEQDLRRIDVEFFSSVVSTWGSLLYMSRVSGFHLLTVWTFLFVP